MTAHEAGGWAHRAMEHTRGTPLLVMLVSMIDKWKPYHAHFIPTRPRELAPAIDAKGVAWVTMVHNGHAHRTALGPVTEVRDVFRRLADDMKLDDADRTAMFDALRAWFQRDDRAKSEDEL